MTPEITNVHLLTQETTVIQLLLELCLESENDDKINMQEVQQMICSFIHQRFIENPLLAKLVHMQTYDIRLLPVTVNGIESIHICMDFLIELLSQPQLEKRVFGIALVSYLVKKYPVQRW